MPWFINHLLDSKYYWIYKMSSVIFSGRKYSQEYLNFGFSFHLKYEKGSNLQVPFCLICRKELTNSSMKEYQLKYHYESHLKKNDAVPSQEDLQVFSRLFLFISTFNWLLRLTYFSFFFVTWSLVFVNYFLSHFYYKICVTIRTLVSVLNIHVLTKNYYFFKVFIKKEEVFFPFVLFFFPNPKNALTPIFLATTPTILKRKQTSCFKCARSSWKGKRNTMSEKDLFCFGKTYWQRLAFLFTLSKP